jgi:putative transposase
VSERVGYARELVAAGHRPAVVARILQISRQAIYRVPEAAAAAGVFGPPAELRGRGGDHRRGPGQPDRRLPAGHGVGRRPGRASGQPQARAARERERRLIQRRRPPARRRRPGFFRVQRPDQLWHLDTTSIRVAEHGWVYLMAALDCGTRQITAWHIQTRCRAREAIAPIKRAALQPDLAPGTLTLGTDNGPALTARAFTAVLGRPGDHAPPRRLPRPPEPAVHRVPVRQPQATLPLAAPIRDPRPRPRGDRRLRRPLPPPAPQPTGPPHAARHHRNPERCRTTPPNPSSLNRQHRRGARHFDPTARVRGRFNVGRRPQESEALGVGSMRGTPCPDDEAQWLESRPVGVARTLAGQRVRRALIRVGGANVTSTACAGSVPSGASSLL